MKSPFANPLLVKELREEMRSRKIFFVVPVYIALLSVVALVAVGSNAGSGFNPVTLSNDARVTMYSFIVTIGILLGLVSVVLGASSFTTEREKTTFELLELTPLSSAELVLGKFLHGFSIILLVLLSSMPVLSTLFFMGGLTYTDLFLSLAYLAVFFAVVLLATIVISIVSSRTIFSIILSLALAFVVSLAMAILSAGGSRSPEFRGFLVVSPWLVTWQQIFQPIPLKLAGHDFPSWPFYMMVYLGLGAVFLCWGRNALDSRKLERNSWVRILSILLINAYVALGILAMKSHIAIKAKDIEDFFQAVLAVIVVLLPCFALGVLTDRDYFGFLRRPVLYSLSPKRLLLNHPSTGVSYLMVLLLTVCATISFCSGNPVWSTLSLALPIYSWIAPWFLLFIAFRLFGLLPRGIFVSYILGAILYTIIVSFLNVSRSPRSFYDFYLIEPGIFLLWIISIVLFFVARAHAARRSRRASVQMG